MPTRKATDARNAGRALALLMKDHRKVQKAFKQFEKMHKAHDSSREDTIREICKELTVHTKMEEELFYPFAREHMEEGDLLDEANVEHAVAKQLVEQLQAGAGSEDERDARFTVLGEYVSHHIEEEETRLFPKLKKMSEELDTLGEQMLDRKIALMEEEGLDAEEARRERERPRRPRQPASRRAAPTRRRPAEGGRKTGRKSGTARGRTG